MNEKFEISLTDEQVQLTFQAIDELRRDGFLVKDATQKTDNFLVLTPEGKTLVEKQEDPDVHGIRLEQIVVDKELLKGSLEPFNDGNYEQAIFLAYKHIEERVRSYAKADAKDIGVHLITLALHPKDGKLIVPTCKLPAEQEGVYNLFKGAVEFFKNPSSHRTVNYEDRSVALEILAFGDLLLGILATSKVK